MAILDRGNRQAFFRPQENSFEFLRWQDPRQDHSMAEISQVLFPAGSGPWSKLATGVEFDPKRTVVDWTILHLNP